MKNEILTERENTYQKQKAGKIDRKLTPALSDRTLRT